LTKEQQRQRSAAHVALSVAASQRRGCLRCGTRAQE
jgi:hypothetical protein